jgi:hypothetical protein
MRYRRRVFMFGRIHQLLPAVVGVLWVATAWADTGYLPLAGPLPLRFRHLPPPVAKPVIVAPPTNAPIALIALPEPPMLYGPPAPTNATAVLPVTVTNAPALEFSAGESVVGPSTPAANAVVLPQMLIHFFTTSTNAATNATSVGVVTPIGFTPPPVLAPTLAPPASTRATYSTSP